MVLTSPVMLNIPLVLSSPIILNTPFVLILSKHPLAH